MSNREWSAEDFDVRAGVQRVIHGLDIHVVTEVNPNTGTATTVVTTSVQRGAAASNPDGQAQRSHRDAYRLLIADLVAAEYGRRRGLGAQAEKVVDALMDSVYEYTEQD